MMNECDSGELTDSDASIETRLKVPHDGVVRG